LVSCAVELPIGSIPGTASDARIPASVFLSLLAAAMQVGDVWPAGQLGVTAGGRATNAPVAAPGFLLF